MSDVVNYVEGYLDGKSASEVDAKIIHWLQALRANDPEFWIWLQAYIARATCDNDILTHQLSALADAHTQRRDGEV